MENETGPKLVGAPLDADRLAVREPGPRRREREVEPGRSAARPASLVHEQLAQRLEVRRVRARVRRHVHRAVVRAVDRHDRDRLAGDVRARRHPDRDHPVEAEHELVGMVVVRHEPRHAQAVHRAEARAVRLVRVDDVRIGARHAEQARAVRQHVVDEPARRARVRREEPRRKRVRHDEVPVRAFADRGQLVVRALRSARSSASGTKSEPSDRRRLALRSAERRA